MMRILAKLFRRASKAQPTGPISPDFSSLEASGFAPSADGRYAVSAEGGCLSLTLSRGRLLAWTELPGRDFGDFSAEATLRLPKKPDSACGLSFHMADDSSFACLLVSRDGWVSLDIVFNGHPRPALPRLECPWLLDQDEVGLTLVSRGDRVVVLLDGRWAFEVADDSLSSGRLGFAARSGDEADAAGLTELVIEERPVEVEVDYARFSRLVQADPDQRRRLAAAHMAAGDYLPAILNLRRLPSPSPHDSFLTAEACMRLELYDEAEAALNACLAADPSMREAQEERLNLLYLQGRYLELKERLAEDGGSTETSPRRLNLLGHALHNLGHFEQAASAYGKAAELDPAMPIYQLNRARELDRVGDGAQAAPAWLAAALGFFAQEAWDDAEACAARLRELGWHESALDSLEARIALGRGRADEAARLLDKLARKRAEDAPAAFARAGLLAARGKRDEALASYRRAVDLDPESPVYRLKLAEALFLAGLDCRAELDAALRDMPEDGWALNLAGQVALADGRLELAKDRFSAAAAALPDAPEPAMNLSEALARLGDTDGALACLRGLGDHAGLLNQKGNLLAQSGRFPEAAQAYGRATELLTRPEPGAERELAADTLCNLAAVLSRLERWAEASDCLRRALELRQDCRSLTLMGDVADRLGEYPRAEAAYRLALEGSEAGSAEHRAALGRLGAHYLARGKYEEAKTRAAELSAWDPEAAALLESRIQAAAEQRLSCADCGREWTLPRPAPKTPKAAFKGEPADESPAGYCPSCGLAFCVACRKEQLLDGRFTCSRCGSRLNLEDDRVRYLVRQSRLFQKSDDF